MSEKTPGQVAYETEAAFWAGGFLGEIREYLPWAKVPPGDRHAYEAAAQAVQVTPERWWIMTDWLNLGGSKVLGPFGSGELAIKVRTLLEQTTPGVTYCVEELEAGR